MIRLHDVSYSAPVTAPCVPSGRSVCDLDLPACTHWSEWWGASRQTEIFRLTHCGRTVATNRCCERLPSPAHYVQNSLEFSSLAKKMRVRCIKRQTVCARNRINHLERWQNDALTCRCAVGAPADFTELRLRRELQAAVAFREHFSH